MFLSAGLSSLILWHNKLIMKRIVLLSVFVSLLACKTDNEKASFALNKVPETAETAKHVLKKDSISVPVYDFNGFEKFLKFTDNKTYVINFWATWCAPCVKELPHFEQLHKKYSEDGVEVILVSLDMPKMYETHLIPFLKKKQLNSKVIALDDHRQNTWIPKVAKDWSGAIPATYIYKNNNNRFVESSLEFAELEQLTLNIKNSN